MIFALFVYLPVFFFILGEVRFLNLSLPFASYWVPAKYRFTPLQYKMV